MLPVLLEDSTMQVEDLTGSVGMKPRSNSQMFVAWEMASVSDAEKERITQIFEALEPNDRKVVDQCAYLGNSFSYRAIKGLAPSSLTRKKEGICALDGILERLVLQNVIKQDEFAKMSYSFYTPTTAVVAYSLTPAKKRTFQHKRVGLWIESTFRDDLRGYFAALMYHFWQAQVWEAMTKYMKLAIQTAVVAGAMLEATMIVDHALELESMPSASLQALLYQIQDCIDTTEEAAQNAAVGPADTPSAMRNPGKQGGESWFKFSKENEGLSLTELVRSQIEEMEVMQNVSPTSDGGGGSRSIRSNSIRSRRTFETTNSPEVKLTILKHAVPRVEKRISDVLKLEAAASEATGEAEPVRASRPPVPDPAGGGMFGRVWKRMRRIAPE